MNHKYFKKYKRIINKHENAFHFNLNSVVISPSVYILCNTIGARSECLVDKITLLTSHQNHERIFAFRQA
jgi:hypothetical protein